MARERKRPISRHEAIGRAVTRKARPTPTGTSAENARALSKTLGNRGAAERLGVSERTLRRYKAGGTPTRANAERLAATARTAPEVRRQALSPRRESRMRNQGAYVRMSAVIDGGTPGARRKNRRRRTIGDTGFTSIHLDGDQMAEILDAYEAGDDQAALEALQEALAEEYDFASINFDHVTLLEFLRDDPNG